MVGDVGFDPLGLSEVQVDLMYARTAELKHGEEIRRGDVRVSLGCENPFISLSGLAEQWEGKTRWCCVALHTHTMGRSKLLLGVLAPKLETEALSKR